jgi:hypothetical protein
MNNANAVQIVMVNRFIKNVLLNVQKRGTGILLMGRVEVVDCAEALRSSVIKYSAALSVIVQLPSTA